MQLYLYNALRVTFSLKKNPRGSSLCGAWNGVLIDSFQIKMEMHKIDLGVLIDSFQIKIGCGVAQGNLLEALLLLMM